MYSVTAMLIFHGRWIAGRKRTRETEREGRKAEIGRKLKGGEQGIVAERRGIVSFSRVRRRNSDREIYREVGQSRGKIRGE